jgi:transcription antitermination factor NusG
MSDTIKAGWYCFSVLYKQEEKILNLIKMYLEKDNYPNKNYLLSNNKINADFSLRYFIEGLGLPRNFNEDKQLLQLPYSDYIFLKIKQCDVNDFNDFLRVIKQIPEVKEVIGQKFDVRPNKRMKPYIYKTYPIVLRDKQEKELRNNVQQFEYQTAVSEIKINAPYFLVRRGLKMQVTTVEIITPVVVEVRDKRDNRIKVNINELQEIKGYNYL